MLVLTRKISQSITIGDNIKLTVLNIDGDRISIGVEAPKDIKIFRSELLEETGSLNRQSLGSEVSALKNFTGKFTEKEKYEKKQ